MLQEMTRLLAKVRAPGSFATRRTSAADDLRLEVKGVGRIGLPIAPATARRLCALARPARHGFKDQTRLDHRIRDTWEIAKSRISIDQPRWRETLLPQLDRIRRDLGLPDGCRLRAELHNLLVYEPGQWQRLWEDADAKHTLDALIRMSKPILGLLESSLIARNPDLPDEIVGFLTSPGPDHPVRVSAHLLRTAYESYTRDALPGLGLKPVHTHCVWDLTTRLRAPARPKDNWSIPAPDRCRCKLCGTLARFLLALDQIRFEWPLAKEQRAHIHRMVDSHDLPVSHTTRRTGRPFTLVLVKTDALFQRDAAERRFWQDELGWLTKTADTF